jgi:hypothetical protein
MGMVVFPSLYPQFLQLIPLSVDLEKMFAKSKPEIARWRKGRKERETQRTACEEKHDYRNHECSKSPQKKGNQKDPAHCKKARFTFLMYITSCVLCSIFLMCYCFTYPTQKHGSEA